MLLQDREDWWDALNTHWYPLMSLGDVVAEKTWTPQDRVKLEGMRNRRDEEILLYLEYLWEVGVDVSHITLLPAWRELTELCAHGHLLVGRESVEPQA